MVHVRRQRSWEALRGREACKVDRRAEIGLEKGVGRGKSKNGKCRRGRKVRDVKESAESDGGGGEGGVSGHGGGGWGQGTGK